MSSYASKRGFTLLELSIVLVIIGLIVGGVMVGRDLIHASELRATVTQKEQFSAAANTFKLKYGCLPGDCAQAVNLGFSGGDGNGDGTIYVTGNYYRGDGDKQYWFWKQLVEAGLIKDQAPDIGPLFNAGDETPTCSICNRSPYTYGGVTSQVGGWLVVDLYALSNSIDCAPSGRTYPVKAPRVRVLALTGSDFAGVGPLTIKPADGAALDDKIDDGKPYSGGVLAVDAYWYSDTGCSGDINASALTAAECTNVVTNTYDTTSPSACFDMIINASF